MSDLKVSTKKQTEITEQVLIKVQQLQEMGNLQLPSDYSAANAIKSAYLDLSEKVDKNQTPVLESCSKTSIANALLTMIVEGLNPIKKQCYFIAYGGKLMYQRGYMGAILLAKRHSSIIDVTAQAIYQDDIFEHEIDAETGLKKILKHNQKLENLDPGKVKGAYCIATLDNGTKIVEIMNIHQIKKSWAMRQGQDMSKAHNEFGDEMAKRTVINRCLKPFINSSSDDEILDEKETIKDQQIKISSSEKTEEISFEDATEIETDDVIEMKIEKKSDAKDNAKDNGGPNF